MKKLIYRIKTYFGFDDLPPDYLIETNGKLWRWDNNGYSAIHETFTRSACVRDAWKIYKLSLSKSKWKLEDEFKKEQTKYKKEEHQKRHKLLHEHLDELVADYITNNEGNIQAKQQSLN